MQIQTQIHQISETKKAKTVRLLETSDLLLHSKKKKTSFIPKVKSRFILAKNNNNNYYVTKK